MRRDHDENVKKLEEEIKAWKNYGKEWEADYDRLKKAGLESRRRQEERLKEAEKELREKNEQMQAMKERNEKLERKINMFQSRRE